MAQFQRAGRNRNPTQFNGKGNCATTLQQLCIEKEGEDTKQLALHRNILSNGCEFFDRMLSGMFQALAQIVSMLLWVELLRSIVRRCCSDASRAQSEADSNRRGRSDPSGNCKHPFLCKCITSMPVLCSECFPENAIVRRHFL